MTQEYWKWPETSFTSKEIDWKKAEKITAGVDVGSSSTQAVVLCDGELFGYASVHTGADFGKTADVAMTGALGNSGLSLKDIGAITATGWGSRNARFATDISDEVLCHAKGGRFMYGPDVHTIVDLGGQTVAGIRLYDWDRVWDFFMNDKCATGMGRNVETICDLLQVPIEDIGELSLDVPADPEPMSTTCFAFAMTETMGQLGRPEFRSQPLTINQVYAAHLFTIATRAVNAVGKLAPMEMGELSVYKELGFTGGLAKNVGVTKRIERYFDVTALHSDYDPILAGAIGAALLA